MSNNLKVKDGDGVDKYIAAVGLGTNVDPNYNVPGDFNLEIARGNVPGFKVVHKFGANGAIPSNTEEPVWSEGGQYNYPVFGTAPITSMSQAVDQVAMRGAEIEWQGLDINGDEVTNIANLDATNTTTIVTLTTPMWRVFRGDVNANVVGDEDIYCHNAGDTVNYAHIVAGENQTTMALYTVPLGKTAYLKRFYATSIESTGKEPISTRFKLYSADRLKNYEFQLKAVVGIPKAGSQVEHTLDPAAGGNNMSELTDIKITAQPVDQIADVAAGFDMIIVDNNV